MSNSSQGPETQHGEVPRATPRREPGEPRPGADDLGFSAERIIAGSWYHPRHSRMASDDERWGRLILGGVGFVMDVHGPMRRQLGGRAGAASESLYYRYAGMSSASRKLARLRIAMELRIRGRLRARDRRTRRAGRRPDGGRRDPIVGKRPTFAPREHVAALGVPGVPVLTDPNLGRGIAIRFLHDPLGLVSGIVVSTGARAGLADIAGHATYVRLLRKFQGAMGALRRSFIGVEDTVLAACSAAPGQPRHAARLAVERLQERIQERAANLVELDGAELRSMIGEIRRLHELIATYRRMDADPDRRVEEIVRGDLDALDGHFTTTVLADSPYVRRRTELRAHEERMFGSRPPGRAPEPAVRQTSMQEQANKVEPLVEELAAAARRLLELVDGLDDGAHVHGEQDASVPAVGPTSPPDPLPRASFLQNVEEELAPSLRATTRGAARVSDGRLHNGP